MSDKPIVWQGRSLAILGAIMLYRGRLTIDPIRGSAYLVDLPDAPLLEEVLPSGEYVVEVRVFARVKREGRA